MRKTLLLLALCLSLAGCGGSGVSQEETGAVVAENEEVKGEVEETQAEEVQETETELVTADTEENSLSEEESDNEIIDSLEYKYDSENYFLVTLNKNKATGRVSVASFGLYEEGKEFILATDFVITVSPPYSKGIDVTYMSTVGEDSYMWLYSEGSLLMNTIPEELSDSLKDIPDEYKDKLAESTSQLYDFYVKNGIAEKIWNELVYEDEKVKIYYAGISSDGVSFNVENMTDINITIQADTVSINGQSANDIIMSGSVAPQSTGKVIARCDDFSCYTDVETVGGQLRIIDFGNSFKSYNATFININVNE